MFQLRSCTVITALTFAIIQVTSHRANGDSDISVASLETISAALQSRRTNVGFVEYVVKGEVLDPKGTFNAMEAALAGESPSTDAPPDDVRLPSNRTVRIDVSAGRIRKHVKESRWNHTTAEYNRVNEGYMFDLNEIQLERPLSMNRHAAYDIPQNTPEYLYYTAPMGLLFLRDSHDLPIYISLGILPLSPYLSTDYARQRLPDDMSIRREGELYTLAHTLPDGGRFVFRVDPAKAFSVVRYEHLSKADEMLYQLEIQYELKQDQWDLTSWTSRQFARGGKLSQSGSFHVASMKRQDALPESDDWAFHVEPPTGAVTLKDGNHYRVAADGSWIQFDPRNQPPPPSSRLGWWVAVTLAIVVIIIVVWRSKRTEVVV